jgi:hypothetical protein
MTRPAVGALHGNVWVKTYEIARALSAVSATDPASSIRQVGENATNRLRQLIEVPPGLLD